MRHFFNLYKNSNNYFKLLYINNLMNKIKKICKHCDYFGVGFNFHYKALDKYHTAIGGFIFILFILFTLFFFIIQLFSFIKGKNMNIMYYKSQLSITDQINLFNYSFVNAFNIKCNNNKYKLNELELFDFEVNYIILKQNKGIINKEIIPINFSLCEYSNFYNKFNESFDLIGLNNKYCFQHNNITIEGTLSDQIFKYIEINLKTKKEDYEIYNTFLKENDCNFEIFYTNYGIDIKNYSNPIKSFIKDIFINLDPQYMNQLDILFGIQEFKTNNNYYKYSKTQYYMNYIENNQFNIYKGITRYKEKMNDYNTLVKINIKADKSRLIIERKYQKITEFIGYITTFVSNILLILYIIVGKINTFYSYQSLMKKLFIFRDTKHSTSRNFIKQMTKKIRGITFSINTDIKINITNTLNKINKINKINNYITTRNHTSNFLQTGFMLTKNLNSSSLKKKYNSFERLNSNESSVISKNISNDLLINNTKYNKCLKKKENSKNIKGEIKISKLINKHLVKFSVLDLLNLTIFPCFINKDLKKNKLLFIKGKIGIYFQLDILNYMKNMTSLEILIYSLLEPYQMKMLRFVTKPCISVANQINSVQQIKNEFNIDITEDDLNELFEQVKIIERKKDRNNVEKRLCQIVNNELENLIGND